MDQACFAPKIRPENPAEFIFRPLPADFFRLPHRRLLNQCGAPRAVEHRVGAWASCPAASRAIPALS